MAEAARYCRACGKKLKGGTTFCPYCGERIEAPGDAPAREARGSEAEISTVAQDAQAAVPKQAPSSTTVSHAPTTRTRVFNPVTTPARASERLSSSSLVTLGVWTAAGIGFISAAIMFVSFAGSLGQAIAELSVLAVPQAALGAVVYAAASLMLIYLIGGLGMGLLRRVLAQRQLRPGRVVAAFVRALVVAVIVAAGMLFVVPALDDASLAHPLAAFFAGSSSGVAKGLFLLFSRLWPMLSKMLPVFGVEAVLLFALQHLIRRGTVATSPAPPQAS